MLLFIYWGFCKFCSNHYLIALFFSIGLDYSTWSDVDWDDLFSFVNFIFVMSGSLYHDFYPHPILFLQMGINLVMFHAFFNVSLIYIILQVDNVSSIQRKTFGLALSIIMTLRLPQVLDKLDQILRYSTLCFLCYKGYRHHYGLPKIG